VARAGVDDSKRREVGKTRMSVWGVFERKFVGFFDQFSQFDQEALSLVHILRRLEVRKGLFELLLKLAEFFARQRRAPFSRRCGTRLLGFRKLTGFERF